MNEPRTPDRPRGGAAGGRRDRCPGGGGGGTSDTQGAHGTGPQGSGVGAGRVAGTPATGR